MCALNLFMTNLLAASRENAGHAVQVRIVEDNAQTMVHPLTTCTTNVSSTTFESSQRCQWECDDDILVLKTPKRIELSLSPRLILKLSAATHSPTVSATRKLRSLHQVNQGVPLSHASPIVVVSHSRIVASSSKSRNKLRQSAVGAGAMPDLGQSWSSLDYTKTKMRRSSSRQSTAPSAA